jgi:high-affinity iron transporter
MTLVLRETLEAILLLAVLLVSARIMGLALAWVLAGIGLGLCGATFYGVNLTRISESFDYMGQEVLNGFMLLAGVGSLTLLAGLLGADCHARHKAVTVLLIVLSATLAVTQEAAEILVYLSGILSHGELVQPVLTGSVLGAGIAVSVGIIVYYGLLSLGAANMRNVVFILLAVIAGSMLSQALLLMTQADWLPYSPVAWDSSRWLSEQTIIGQLFYALAGYEATPSVFQVIGYVGAASIVLMAAWVGHIVTRQPTGPSHP